MNKASTHYEVAVIGGGSGGYAVARTVASAGLKTIILEGGAQVGGLCILRGCMPTKALLYAAEVMHLARHAETWGIKSGPIDCDFRQVMARKDALIKEFAAYRVGQLTSGSFDFVRAQARFLDSHTLQLGSGRKVTADRIVIATGSVVSEPPLPDLAKVGYLDSDGALQLTQLPKSMIVLGGGAVALEFAQFFGRLGVQISLVQRGPHVLKGFDTDASEAVESAMRREGITVYTGTRLQGAWQQGSEKGITFEHRGQSVGLVAEEIFFALGRSPHTSSLGLEKIGLEMKGARIVTDAFMRTSQPHIYAVGDCTGPHEIVHIAIKQGEIAGQNIAFPERPERFDDRLLINIVFTDPQVATVGFTEHRAQAEHRPFQTASYPFNDHGKSIIMNAQEGFVKLLADPGSGEILGGACVGPVGGELIHEIVVAMAKSMTVGELAAVPHYHPTLAEIWTYPAEELAGKIKGSPTDLEPPRMNRKESIPDSNALIVNADSEEEQPGQVLVCI